MSFANDIPSFCKRYYPTREGEEKLRRSVVAPFEGFLRCPGKLQLLGGEKDEDCNLVSAGFMLPGGQDSR